MTATNVATLIGNAFGSVFGGNVILGAMLVIFFAYVAFKSGMSLSSLVFLGVLLAGTMVVLGYLDLIWFAVILIVGALLAWRAFMQVAG